jgi:nitroimidazol reductase NimA-like FMN-containing flavoprotein (pyridoxamine 5'-phosphate oxidase superfamily)
MRATRRDVCRLPVHDTRKRGESVMTRPVAIIPHMSQQAPVIRALDRAACEALLARGNVGRVAFATHQRVDIEPLHYAFLDGWIYGRTSPGSKLDVVAHSHWVAFEADEVAGVFDWRSVVVHGAWFGQHEAPPAEHAAWERGLDALRRLVPGTFTRNDPVPFRTVLFRIHLDEVTGRECRPAPGPG